VINPPEQLRFHLRRLARRWWQYRAAEAFGEALFIGAVLGLVVVPLMAWQGEPSWPVAGVMLMLASLVGGIIALQRKPTLLQAAIKADGQWKLDDLLATAITIDSCESQTTLDPSMRHMVIATAAAELAARSRDPLILNRFGPRAWSAVGLSTALLFSVTAICSHPLVLKAADRRAFSLKSNREPASPDIDFQHPDSTLSARTAPEEVSENRDVADARSVNSASANQSGDFIPGAATDGAKNSSSDDAIVAGAEHDPDSTARQSGDTAAGSGRASAASVSDATAGGVVTQIKPPPPRPAPWKSDRWETHRAAAMNSLAHDPPPAIYRDLIRDYFSR